MNKNALAVAWIVSILVLSLPLLQGCDKKVPVSPEAERELVIRYKADGTKEVTDGTGAGLEKIPLDDPPDVVGSLARRLGKDVLQVETNNPFVVNSGKALGADVSAMEPTANVRRGDVPIDNNSWTGS